MLLKVLRSFKDWEAAIIQSIIQPYSNGFTEGCNNAVKTVRKLHLECVISTSLEQFSYLVGKKGTRQMPCRVPKRRFSCGAPQHLTKNLFFIKPTFACNETGMR